MFLIINNILTKNKILNADMVVFADLFVWLLSALSVGGFH